MFLLTDVAARNTVENNLLRLFLLVGLTALGLARAQTEKKRSFYRGTTFYDQLETVATQRIDTMRIRENQAAYGFSPDRMGVYFTSQLWTAGYYSTLAGGSGRGGGPGIIAADVPEKQFDIFAARYGISVEVPVPTPPVPGQTETLIPFYAMPDFERISTYRGAS